MLVLFHAICVILTELSTPVWQNEVTDNISIRRGYARGRKKLNRFDRVRVLEISLDRAITFL